MRGTGDGGELVLRAGRGDGRGRRNTIISFFRILKYPTRDDPTYISSCCLVGSILPSRSPARLVALLGIPAGNVLLLRPLRVSSVTSPLVSNSDCWAGALLGVSPSARWTETVVVCGVCVGGGDADGCWLAAPPVMGTVCALSGEDGWARTGKRGGLRSGRSCHGGATGVLNSSASESGGKTIGVLLSTEE